MSQEKCSAAII